MIALSQQIVEKLRKEYSDYERNLLTHSSKEIYNSSYQTAIKFELVCAVENEHDFLDNLPPAITARMLSTDNLLDFLYESWLDCDINISESLSEFIFYLVEDTSLFGNLRQEETGIDTMT